MSYDKNRADAIAKLEAYKAALPSNKGSELDNGSYEDFTAFKSYAKKNYSKAYEAMSVNDALYGSVLNQFQYNQKREKSGLSALRFADPAYDPNQFDEDTNEYLSSFAMKNKRLPTGEDKQDFDKGLVEYKKEKAKERQEAQAKEAYPALREQFENELYNALWSIQQKEYQAASEENREPFETDWEDVISRTLAQEKYRGVAKNFIKSANANAVTGYSRIAAMLRVDKNKNPDVFTEEDLIQAYVKRAAAQSKQALRD